MERTWNFSEGAAFCSGRTQGILRFWLSREPMSDDRSRIAQDDLASGEISIYRPEEAERVLGEKAARLAEEVMFNLEGAIELADRAVREGQMPEEVVRELREIHTRVRQRALATSPQGRLV